MQNDASPMPEDQDQSEAISSQQKVPNPSWLFTELRGEYQPPVKQEHEYASPVDMTLEREVAQLRAEVELYRAEVARYRQQVSQMRAEALMRGRGGCLTAWLVLQSIGIALLIFLTFRLTAQGNATVVFLTIPLAVLTAISIYGLWKLKKWGYRLQVFLYCLGFAFSSLALFISLHNYSAGIPPYTLGATDLTLLTSAVFSSVGSIVGMLILYVLVHERWKIFE